MIKQYLLLCMMLCMSISVAMTPTQSVESWESVSESEDFDSGHERSATPLSDRSGGSITPELELLTGPDARCDQSYEQRCLCCFCAGLALINGTYTLGRITPNEQHPVVPSFFGVQELDPFQEHGLTCLAAISAVWLMPSGQADHSCCCGACKKYLTSMCRLRNCDKDCSTRMRVPQALMMPITAENSVKEHSY